MTPHASPVTYSMAVICMVGEVRCHFFSLTQVSYPTVNASHLVPNITFQRENFSCGQCKRRGEHAAPITPRIWRCALHKTQQNFGVLLQG